jgi:hypothetical protein
MNPSFFSDSFRFLNINLKKKSHYTDARSGCPAYYLAYMIAGHAKIVSDEKTIYIKEGDVFYIPKGLRYRSHWYPEGEFYSFGFGWFPAEEGAGCALQKIECTPAALALLAELESDLTVSPLSIGRLYRFLGEVRPAMQAAAADAGEAGVFVGAVEAGDRDDHDRRQRRLRQVLEERCEEGAGQHDERGGDERGELRLSVRHDHLLLLEAADNYVCVWYLSNGEPKKVMVRNSLKRLSGQLDSTGIVRCHRSYMVNIDQVKVVRREKDGAMLDLGIEGIPGIPISQTYNESVTRWLVGGHDDDPDE